VIETLSRFIWFSNILNDKLGQLGIEDKVDVLYTLSSNDPIPNILPAYI